MHFLAFSLILGLSLAQNSTPSECGGCVVYGYPAGLLWDDVHEFLNETVYLEVDQTDNSTRTIKTEANTAAASSFSSLCTSAYDSIIKDWGYPDGTGIDACFSNGIVTQTFFGDSDRLTAERAYPTTHIMFSSVYVLFSSLTTVSGIRSCQASSSFVTSWFDYVLSGDDTTVLTSFTNSGHVITWESMPHGLLTAIPDLSKCTPGTGPGVPVTKIPVVGTASTVYQYKSKTKQNPPPVSPAPEPGSTPPVTVADPTKPVTPKETSVVNPPSPSTPDEVNPPSPSTPNEVNPPSPSGPNEVNPPSPSGPDEVNPPSPSGSDEVNSPSHSGPDEVNPPAQTTAITTRPSQKESPALTAPAIVIGTKTVVLAPSASGGSIPEGYSLLPSGSGVVLPNGNTLLPGTVTTIDGVPVSVAPSGIGKTTTNTTTAQSTTSSVIDDSQSAAEGKRAMLQALASLAGVGVTVLLLT